MPKPYLDKADRVHAAAALQNVRKKKRCEDPKLFRGLGAFVRSDQWAHVLVIICKEI